MNYTAISTDAPSGARINTTVELLQEDEEPFLPKPWQAVTTVDYHPVVASHHATLGDARRQACKTHASYVEVHTDYPEYRELRAAELAAH